MVLPTLFQRFVEKAPLCVMARALLERSLQASDLDDLFERLATVQYTRELAFSSVVDLLSQVALRSLSQRQPRLLRASRTLLGVSLTAVYDKLNNLEPQFGPALVRHSAFRCRRSSPPWTPTCPPGVPACASRSSTATISPAPTTASRSSAARPQHLCPDRYLPCSTRRRGCLWI